MRGWQRSQIEPSGRRMASLCQKPNLPETNRYITLRHGHNASPLPRGGIDEEGIS